MRHTRVPTVCTSMMTSINARARAGARRRARNAFFRTILVHDFDGRTDARARSEVRIVRRLSNPVGWLGLLTTRRVAATDGTTSGVGDGAPGIERAKGASALM